MEESVAIQSRSAQLTRVAISTPARQYAGGRERNDGAAFMAPFHEVISLELGVLFLLRNFNVPLLFMALDNWWALINPL